MIFSRRTWVRLAILATFLGVWFLMRTLDGAAQVPGDAASRRSGEATGLQPSSEPERGDERSPGVGSDELGAEHAASDPAAQGPDPEAPPAPSFVPVRLFGRVKGGEDLTPVADAALRAYTISPGSSGGMLVEVTGTSDSEGLYGLDLAVAQEWGGDSEQVWVGVEVETPDGRALEQVLVDVSELSAEARHDTWVEPGGGYEGRVLDANGDPAGRAEVFLFGSFDAGGEGSWIEVGRMRALPDGRFLVHAPRSGSYTLRARADGLGATLRDLGSFAGSSFEAVPDIYLSGGGVMAGRVADPAGNGIPGVWVRAVHADFEPDWERAISEATRLNEGSLGQLYGEVQSDPRGEFRLGGLAPGEFWILCEAGGAEVTEGLDRGPYPVGRRDLLLRLAEYRLSVELGQRPGGAQPRGRAYCAELVPAPGSIQGSGTERWQPRGEVQTRPLYEVESAVFRVLPERRYAIGVASSSLPPLEQIIVVEGSDFRPSVKLEPGRAQPFGRVRIWVDTPQGDLLNSALVSVVSPASGVTIQEYEVPIGSEGYLLDLAPGHYQILAGPRDWPGMGRPLLPGRVEVQVASGETQELELHARSGAELSVTLRVQGPIEDRELAAAYQVILETGDRPSPKVRGRHGVSVRLEPNDGGASRIVEFVFADGLKPFPATALLPGETARVAEVLEPGAYLLTLEAPGFEPVTQLLDIDVTEKNAVTIELVARQAEVPD